MTGSTAPGSTTELSTLRSSKALPFSRGCRWDLLPAPPFNLCCLRGFGFGHLHAPPHVGKGTLSNRQPSGEAKIPPVFLWSVCHLHGFPPRTPLHALASRLRFRRSLRADARWRSPSWKPWEGRWNAEPKASAFHARFGDTMPWGHPTHPMEKDSLN